MKALLGTAPSGYRKDNGSAEMNKGSAEMEFGIKTQSADSPNAKEGVLSTKSAFRVDAVAATEQFAERLQRRAIEAVIWGMPMVTFDALRQAFFRDAQASYGDIAYWSKPADWSLQLTAPTASAYYTYFNFNTKEGPVVFDLPAIVEDSLSGSIFNARADRLIDIGARGVDKGRGGKFLLLPPQYKGIVPSGYIPIRCTTYNGYALLSSPPSRSLTTVKPGSGLTKKMRVYPFSSASQPPNQRFIDMSGRVFDAVVRFDDTFFDSLARIVNEEPPQVCDLVAMNQIYGLGIEQGKPFRPDVSTREILRRSAREVHTHLMQNVMNGESWWPAANWKMSDLLWSRTPFSKDIAARLGIDERNARFFQAFAAPQEHNEKYRSLAAFNDGADQPLRGESHYRLRIPADVPAQRWTVTVYDLNTACFIRESPRVAIDVDDRLKRNADGSIDLCFGPTSPACEEANWIYTAPGKRWFTVFQLCRPQKAIFDKKWTLSNLEEISTSD